MTGLPVEVAERLLDTDYLETEWLRSLAEVERLEKRWNAGRDAEIAAAVKRWESQGEVRKTRAHAVQDGLVTWNNSRKAQRIGEAIAGNRNRAQTYLLAFIACKLRAGQVVNLLPA